MGRSIRCLDWAEAIRLSGEVGSFVECWFRGLSKTERVTSFKVPLE